VKALTVRQPWAAAIIWHGKCVENRSRPVSYRGPLLIHAGLAEPEWGEFLMVSNTASTPPTWTEERRTRGAILGIVTVDGCHHAADCRPPDRQDGRRPRYRTCSPWAQVDQFHWMLTDPWPLAEPVPARGMLGLWNVPEEAERAVRAQLGESDVG
jgi:hypothetical protein